MGVDVYVKLTTGRCVQYDVRSSSQIADLVSMVAKDEGVPQKQVNLKYQGKVLTTTKTVGQYGVRAETILKSEVLVPKSLALVLNLPEDRVEEITISNLETSSTLFDIISEKTGIASNTLHLEWNKQEIKNSDTRLSIIGLENCSTIDVTQKYKNMTSGKVTTESGASAVPDVMDDGEKEDVMSSFLCHGRQVEVVFSFDTTGSMYSYLDQVRSKLRECCTRLTQDIPRIRIGLIAHGDYCDQSTYVLRSEDLTSDTNTLVRFANDVPSTGGGDAPECYEWVLHKAQHLDWSEDSAKALVVIGDLYPHPPSFTDQNIKWRDELDVLKGMGVKVYGVQAGVNTDAKHFYAEIAEETGGRHLRLNHFDIITDMFLAVCYREGNEQLLEEFQEELQGAGRMTEQTKAMFQELKETDEDKQKKKEEEKANAASSSQPKRYVKSEWWDHSLAAGSRRPAYTYDEQTDKWSPYRDPTESSDSGTPAPPSSSSSSPTTTFTSGRTRHKKRCSVM